MLSRILISFVSLVTLLGSNIADWNNTHIFSELWSQVQMPKKLTPSRLLRGARVTQYAGIQHLRRSKVGWRVAILKQERH
jgi:hypothetical protein